MNEIKFIIFLACTFLLYSCQPPEGSGIKNIIEGYIYYDCDMAPYANKDLVLFQTYASSMGGNTTGGELAYTTTDSSGHFRFEYNAENEYEVLIKTDAGYGIIGLPIDMDIHDVVAYYDPTCNIQLSLNVINPHEAGDTLHITYYDGTGEYYVLCPLTSGVLWTATDYALLGMNYNGSSHRILWYFNSFEGEYEEYDYIINEYCGDTTFVTVDIY